MVKEFTQAQFVGCLHSEFQIIENAAPVCILELTNIVERAKTPGQETFSLMFLGPLATFVPQGMRTLRHSALGELEIFLVPVGRDKDGFEYEAVFNLLTQSS